MKDLGALAFISGIIGVSIALGAACALFSHWLTLLFWRIGATETPAAWVAYGLTLCVLAFVMFTVGGRLTMGEWFWNERE